MGEIHNNSPYDDFTIEELQELLRLRMEQLADLDARIKKAERDNELLEKESNNLTKRIIALTQENKNLSEELEIACMENKGKEDPEGLKEIEKYIVSYENTDEEEDSIKKLSVYKQNLYKQTKKFLEEVSYSEFEKEIGKMVIGQDISPILVSVYSFLQNIVKERCQLTSIPSRILLTGPSGCGKTQTYRALAAYFNGRGNQKGKIPMLQILHIDLSGITTAGFKGREMSSIPAAMIVSEGLAICFCVEADKFLSQKVTSKNINVSHEVQAEFLSILEGITINYSNDSFVRTQDTLFICDGSFDAIRREKKSKASEKEKTVGFVRQHDNKTFDAYEKITREDILNYGSTAEFLGRINLICQLGRLSSDAIYLIIEKYRKEISTALNVDLYLSDSYILQLIESSNGEFGCRLLYSSIYERTIKAVASAMRQGMKPGYTVNLDSDDVFELREVDESMPEFTPDFLQTRNPSSEELGTCDE